MGIQKDNPDKHPQKDNPEKHPDKYYWFGFKLLYTAYMYCPIKFNPIELFINMILPIKLFQITFNNYSCLYFDIIGEKTFNTADIEIKYTELFIRDIRSSLIKNKYVLNNKSIFTLYFKLHLNLKSNINISIYLII